MNGDDTQKSMRDFVRVEVKNIIKISILLSLDFLLVTVIVAFSAVLIKIAAILGISDSGFSVAGQELNFMGVFLEMSAALYVFIYIILATVSLVSAIKMGIIRIPASEK